MSQPSVFISYSHKDQEWKDRLVQHLRVLADEQDFDVWDDRRLDGGADWKAEIERAILSADVAVMLVSVGFLTSAFIKGQGDPAATAVARGAPARGAADHRRRLPRGGTSAGCRR